MIALFSDRVRPLRTTADEGGVAACAPDDVLFVLAHQDDETGAIATLVREQRAGSRCWLAYLTDGGRYDSTQVRDAETIRALQHLHIHRSRTGFLSDVDGRIPDGELMHHLTRARTMLVRWLANAGVTPARIYTLDWEGGHVDHDAAHLVALSLACNGNPTVDGFALYNAYRRLPRFARLRVRDLVPAAGPIAQYPVAWRTAFLAASSPFWYPSQRSTWRMLGPGFIARTLVQRRERLRRASVRRTEHRPHSGKLLYETFFGVPYASFADASRVFRATLR